jgi:hypothetical protein
MPSTSVEEMAMPEHLSDDIKRLGLEQQVFELEMDGVSVVPPEVHGVPLSTFDELTRLLLEAAEEMTGVAFNLDEGPTVPLGFPAVDGLSGAAQQANEEPSQFLIQQLGRRHRRFRDLAVNPVAVALIRHMVGQQMTRFSSHNSFVKWQGDFGYGPTLGLHVDQGGVPMPWGRQALTANTNWCLTDYTLAGGALACVRGSHRRVSHPVQPGAVKEAEPIECPRGSVIVFHGATWHGAYPRKIPGMRISIANYYRHHMVTSQEDIHGTFPPELADDCCDPALFKTLAGFDDKFPYERQTQAVPFAASTVAVS